MFHNYWHDSTSDQKSVNKTKPFPGIILRIFIILQSSSCSFSSFLRLWTLVFRRKWFRRIKYYFLFGSFRVFSCTWLHWKNSDFLRMRAILNDCIFSKWKRKICFSLMDELSKRYIIAQMNARNEHHWNRCLNLWRWIQSKSPNLFRPHPSGP